MQGNRSLFKNRHAITLKSQSHLGLIMRIFAAGAGLLINGMIARALGADEYGRYATIISLILLVAIVASLGWPGNLVQLMNRNAQPFGPEDHNGFMLLSLGTTLAAGIVFGGILVSSKDLMLRFWPILSTVPFTVFVMAGLLIVVQALSLTRAGFVRGLHLPLQSDMPELLIRPALSALLIGSFIVARGELNLERVFELQGIAFGTSLIVGLALLVPVYKGRKINWPQGWIAPAIPFWAIGPVGTLLSQMPIYLVASLAGDAETGRLAIALQFVTVLSIAIAAHEMPIQSRIAEACARSDFHRIEQIAREAGRSSWWMCVGLALVAALLAQTILGIFGPGYEAAKSGVWIMLAGVLGYCALGPCRVVLSMTGGERTVLYVHGMAIVASLLACLLLIPRFGMEGAAAGSALVTLGTNLALHQICWKRHGIIVSSFLPRSHEK